MGIRMVKVAKLINLELSIGETGNKIREMDSGGLSQTKGIIMKETFKGELKLDKVLKFLKTATGTKAIIQQISFMVKVII